MPEFSSCGAIGTPEVLLTQRHPQLGYVRKDLLRSPGNPGLVRLMKAGNDAGDLIDSGVRHDRPSLSPCFFRASVFSLLYAKRCGERHCCGLRWQLWFGIVRFCEGPFVKERDRWREIHNPISLRKCVLWER